MAHDPATRQVVLFGGLDRSENALGETWIWDGVSWSQQTPATSPQPRYGAAMAYDAASGQLIMFGGTSATGGRFGGTWMWTGTNWVNLHPTTSPPPESSSAMAYDPAMGKLVLFGGLQGSGQAGSNQTWAWNGATWSKLTPATVPPARAAAAMDYDTTTAQLVLYGGADNGVNRSDTWVWNGSNWLPQSATNPGPLSEMSLNYDGATSQLLLVAGLGDSNPVVGATWSWTGTTWTQLNPPTPLSPRYLHYAAYDARNRELVVFGGTVNGIFLSDTWLYGPPEIPPQHLAPATVGARYSASLTTIAGTPPDTWSVTSGALPPGLSLSPAGMLSGTPTTAGTVNFTVTAMDAESPAAQATRTITLKVNPPPPAAVWVTDVGDNFIHSFPLAASGNTTPLTTIGGPLTGVNTAGGIVVDKTGAVYVSNLATPSIAVFAPGASGNVAPARTIAGPNTGLAQPTGLAFDSAGLLYVANQLSNSITVYAPGASGDAAPVQTISGVDTELDQPLALTVDKAGDLWVANATGNRLTEYAPGASGDAIPVGVFTGSATLLNDPSALTVDANRRVLVANRLGESVAAFAPQPPFGNIAPPFVISGSQSQLSYPDGLDVDNANNLYVANQFGGVNIYAPNSTAPARVIAGALTGLVYPHSVAVAPPLTVATTSLPTAAPGRRYRFRLVADLGTAPFRWRITQGRLPRGLRLSATGLISGVPDRLGQAHFTVAVTDSTQHAMHDTRRLTLTVRPAPVLTGVRPSRGRTRGGTTVTITGSGFATARGATVIAFGRVRALAVHCSSHTRCTARVPPHAAGTVLITVSVDGLVSAPARRDRYTYARRG